MVSWNWIKMAAAMKTFFLFFRLFHLSCTTQHTHSNSHHVRSQRVFSQEINKIDEMKYDYVEKYISCSLHGLLIFSHSVVFFTPLPSIFCAEHIYRNILIPFPMNCELVFMDIHSIIAKQQTFVYAVFSGLIVLLLCCVDTCLTAKQHFSCVLSFLVVSSSQYRICVHSINEKEEKMLPLVLDDLRPLWEKNYVHQQTASISIVLEFCYHHSFISILISLLYLSLFLRLIYAISSNHQTLMWLTLELISKTIIYQSSGRSWRCLPLEMKNFIVVVKNHILI